jgi:hypothetical protein
MAAEKGVVLELVRWETHSWPGAGTDVQDVINHQISAPDIFIGILWKRFGTPTPRAGSGTEEEFQRALKAWRSGARIEILMYFSRETFYPESEDDLTQMSRIVAFRRSLAQTGVLFAQYASSEEFERTVHDNLSQVLRSYSVATESHEDLIGVWSGGGNDLYVENGSLPIDLQAELIIDSASYPLAGRATISSEALPEAKATLLFSGTLERNRYLQMTYRSAERLRHQLGVVVFALDDTGKTMTGHYAGYSPTRKTFVMGRLTLHKSN